MKNSALVEDIEHCVICGKDAIQRHHVFFGSCRKNADDDGYWIPLCQKHHTGPEGIHFNSGLARFWKELAQRHYEKSHTRNQFIQRYGKNYL